MKLTQKRLDELVAAGALIEVIKFGVPVLDIAKATVKRYWEGGYMLRHCCMFPNDGHDTHSLQFDTAEDNGRSILLRENGIAIAGIAPYMDWPELDVGEYLARRGRWLHLLDSPVVGPRFKTFFKEA